MQPIIVAIDFSNTSLHALEYAIMMANKMNSDIHLVWVDKVTSLESVYPDTSNETRNEAKKRFDEIIAQYRKKLAGGISIDFKLKKGKIYREVDNLARAVGAELIITGAHGISGYEEHWIGSNAFKIVTYASSPVITVRHDFPVSSDLKRILLPVDGSSETLQKVPFVVKLAQLFGSEVHLVTTHTSHLGSIQRIAEKNTIKAREYMQKMGVSIIDDSIIASDLTKSVMTYSEQIKADLIAIMTEEETPANVLLSAQSQQLINQSAVPVLSIHPIEKFNLE
jgi:nucleotide-binding universal stress UspA family protein